MTKYIVFDFDGTLANSIKAFVGAYNQLAEMEGYRHVEMEDIGFLSKLSIPERCRHLKFPMKSIPLAAPKLYRYIRQSQQPLELFPGVKEMLEELKKNGYKLAIISSNAEDIISKSLKENGVDFFDDILCSKYIFSKDKLIRKLLKKYKAPSSSALYIGDESRDIVASKKSGVEVVWAAWGYDAEEVALPAAPDYVANTPGEIISILSAQT